MSLILAAIVAGYVASRFPGLAPAWSRPWWLLYVGTLLLILLVLSILSYVARERAEAKKDAAAATAEAKTRYVDIDVQAGGVSRAAERAAFYLDVATRELRDHRYALFWDAMETAAAAIGDCHTCLGYLAFDVNRYVDILSGRVHDFPTWDTAPAAIPDVAPLLARFAALKNDAESDFHFANIRELRETRQVMIVGFRTLGEALRQLERTVETSIGELKRAVDNSIALRMVNSTHLQTIARFLIQTARDDAPRR